MVGHCYFLQKNKIRLISWCGSGNLPQLEIALSHGVDRAACAAFGVNSITAWLTQASDRWFMFCKKWQNVTLSQVGPMQDGLRDKLVGLIKIVFDEFCFNRCLKQTLATRWCNW